jgi:protein-tyrosine phosphatase
MTVSSEKVNRHRPTTNTYWVNEHLLAGEYPGDRDENVARSKLAAYLKAGVTCFVDLTEAHELVPYNHLLPSISPSTGRAIRYHRHPIRDVSVPRSRSEMTAILDTIDQAIEEGHTVYVHCWGGVGRTGTVVGCYLVRHGLDGEAALAELERLWRSMEKSRIHPQTPETRQQRQYILAWAER